MASSKLSRGGPIIKPDWTRLDPYASSPSYGTHNYKGQQYAMSDEYAAIADWVLKYTQPQIQEMRDQIVDLQILVSELHAEHEDNEECTACAMLERI